jgi:hypothetical protein
MCLKSVFCGTGKRVCVWSVRIFLSKTWIAQPYTHPVDFSLKVNCVDKFVYHCDLLNFFYI